MNIRSRFTRILAIAIGTATFMAAYPQLAQAYSCSSVLLAPNDGCAQGNFALDNPQNIAIDAPFGISDWTTLDTSNDGFDDALHGISIFTVDTSIPNVSVWGIMSGNQNPWDIFDNMMITLQGTPGNYVAFALRPDTTIGLYIIPGNQSDLRHARLWGTISTVPLPAALWLFGSGLVGLIAVSGRRITTTQA
jgi:hypothetical protein